jgi:glycosyltransferase involved in cell wall biosynthesis
MIRIAFLLSLTDQWAGGISYYENLFKAIRLADAKGETALIGVLDGRDNRHARVLSLLDEICEVPPVDAGEKWRMKIFYWLRRYPSLRRFAPELRISRALRQLGADIIFTSALPGYRSKIPVIGWTPDFQFRHMPELFPQPLRTAVENDAIELGTYSDAVVLSSRAALEDFKSLLPSYSQKGRVIHFVAGVDAEVYEKDPAWVCREYELSDKFFYLPNQFWKHKNHELVLDALEIARSAAPDIQVVSTGLLSDHRHLTYPSEFLTAISRKKLRSNFIVLGYVPRSHLFSLMRQSIAVLQPSRFEGWSTSVEEAKSLGKQILLSDIPVHREQNPPRGRFFPLEDARALSDLMADLWKNTKPGPDVELEEEARRRFPLRFMNFGEEFLSVIRENL